jgi:hypothetical protein
MSISQVLRQCIALLGARASSPLLTQARRLRSQGTGSAFTKQTSSTLLRQTHNAIDRKLFMMKAFYHPKGHQEALLRGLAHLYNLVPYQRRTQHAGQCRVEVASSIVPTHDWLLNPQLLTSGGFR